MRVSLTKIVPASDSRMEWDGRRYCIRRSEWLASFENGFVDDGTLDRRLRKNSRKVYNAILARISPANADVVREMISGTKEGKDYLYDIQLEQMEADSESAYNDLSSTPAINFATGGSVDRQALKANQLSVDAEQVMERSESYFGVNIFYAKPFPAWLRKAVLG